jgi:hypothetical protein
MKQMIVALFALSLTGTGALAADANGNGPLAPITPYTIWMVQSQKGIPYTPMHELMAKANGDQQVTQK